MSKVSSVGFASILIGALALSVPASATSIFQKGTAQFANPVSDGHFNVTGKVNDNGTESFDISSLSQPKSPFSAGTLPAGMWKFDGFDNNDANGDLHSSGGAGSDKSSAAGSQTGATSGSNGIGMGGISGGAGGSLAVNNFSPPGKGLLLNNPMLASTTTNSTTANDPAGDPPAVPLPGAFPLLASGLGALALLGWRRKRKARI